MKKLKARIKFWHYTRLFNRLYWLFLHRGLSATDASIESTIAFQWLTGRDYAEWYAKAQEEFA